MNETIHPLDQAALMLGGRAAMAELLNVTPAAIGNWKTRGAPIEQCPSIERITSGVVSRRVLRPNDWQIIWPELADTTATELVRSVKASMQQTPTVEV
jgi:DNA-binding transcriptional regulator YdaS (Cro superfamily)